ncbi:hypothetical protein OCG28_001922 [Salmonella enterica]|nr:hypothetical protein [Salmonella enterica]
MENLLVIIGSIAAIAFWIGLFKPSWVGMPNRKKSSLVYLLVCIVIGGTKGYLYPTQQSAEEISAAQEKTAQAQREAKRFKYPTTTLGEYQAKPAKERKDIISDYLISEDFKDSAFNGFYNCLSEYAATKSDDLQISEVLSWCANDYKQDPKSLDSRTNFDTFFAQFSGWDGSYRPLEKAIKESMNDEDSYKHIKTTYRVIMKDNPHAIVSTTFSGTNAYAARVKQTISADVDIKSGQITRILSE